MIKNLFGSVLLLVFFVASSTVNAKNFTRSLYEDSDDNFKYFVKEFQKLGHGPDRSKELAKERMEEAYGSDLILMPFDNDTIAPPGGKKIKVEGTFLLSSYDDENWVETEKGKNIAQDFLDLKRLMVAKMKVRFPDMKNISDKWDEYRFVSTLFPDAAPPEMHVATDFIDEKKIPNGIKERVRASVKEVLRKKGLAAEHEDEIVKIELVRAQMNFWLNKTYLLEDLKLAVGEKAQRAILKNRELNHSEGKLPKTDKNWAELFADYIKSGTRDKIKKIENEGAGGFAEAILELPFREGFVLQTILHKPKDIIAQHMIELQREVRIHIVAGQILPDATFLRFYHINEYLPKEDKDKIHEAVERNFLAKLDPVTERPFFFCTPDVVIEKGTGMVRLLDFNDGIDSGYYEPDEDMFTTNQLAYFYRGEDDKPRYLKIFDNFAEISISDPQKLDSLKQFIDRSHHFMEGDVLNAYWDRITGSYLDQLAALKDETTKGAEFITALRHFEAAGLKEPEIFLQFIAHFQDDNADRKVSRAALREWKDKLKTMKEGVTVHLVEGETKLVGEETEEVLTKKEIKEIRKKLKQRGLTHPRDKKVKPKRSAKI